MNAMITIAEENPFILQIVLDYIEGLCKEHIVFKDGIAVCDLPNAYQLKDGTLQWIRKHLSIKKMSAIFSSEIEAHGRSNVKPEEGISEDVLHEAFHPATP